MTIEATPRANAFAAFQQKLVSAGIRVGSPTMTGLQQAAQTYAGTVADEAVAGATLCLTEHDIGHAISMWADEEAAKGELVREHKLRQACHIVLAAAKDVDEERAVAVLNLPPAAPELPQWVRDRVDGVLRLVYGEKAEPAPIHRLFATVVHEMVRTATGQAPSDVNALIPSASFEAAARARGWRPREGGGFEQVQDTGVTVVGCMRWEDLCRVEGIAVQASSAPAVNAPETVEQPAQQQQARDVRGSDGSWMGDPDKPHVRDVPLKDGPQFETHNFPGTPGGPPASSKMVQTMIPEGGVHLPSWERAVHACADRLREDGHARLALALVDDVKPPKAG